MSRHREIFDALDKHVVPLPKDVLLDTLCHLVDLEVPDPADDDELEQRWDSIYAWAEARDVWVRV